MDEPLVLRALAARQEVVELVSEMTAAQRRLWIHLGHLYLERGVAPRPGIERHIARIEAAISGGLEIDVPATQ